MMGCFDMKKIRAVLFDRDGTLNVDTGYLHNISEFQWMPDAPEALSWLNRQNIKIYVITNQSGIARGYFTFEDMNVLHEYMNDSLLVYGAQIEKFYYCPHLPDGAVSDYAVDCTCRKPKPGLILRCLKENFLDADECIMIGDKPRDIECAENAGVRGFLYDGGSLLKFVKEILCTRISF